MPVVLLAVQHAVDVAQARFVAYDNPTRNGSMLCFRCVDQRQYIVKWILLAQGKTLVKPDIHSSGAVDGPVESDAVDVQCCVMVNSFYIMFTFENQGDVGLQLLASCWGYFCAWGQQGLVVLRGHST